MAYFLLIKGNANRIQAWARLWTYWRLKLPEIRKN